MLYEMLFCTGTEPGFQEIWECLESKHDMGVWSRPTTLGGRQQRVWAVWDLGQRDIWILKDRLGKETMT